MGIVDPEALERLFDERPVKRCANRLAKKGGDRLLRNVRRNTPVDTNPYRSRPERPVATLRDSMEGDTVREEVRGGERVLVYVVGSSDPVARLVEFDTRPHKIRPHNPDGFLRFQSRHGFTDAKGLFHPPGTWVSVREIDHPGTKGAHMFSLGALKTEAEFAEFSRPILDRLVGELGRGGR